MSTRSIHTWIYALAGAEWFRRARRTRRPREALRCGWLNRDKEEEEDEENEDDEGQEEKD